MINLEAYNKFINTKDGVDGDSYFVYLKQDNLDMHHSFLNLQSELINSWSSKKHNEASFATVLMAAKERMKKE